MTKNKEDEFSKYLPTETQDDDFLVSSSWTPLLANLPEAKEVTVEMTEEETDKQDLIIANNYLKINQVAMRSATNIGSLLLLSDNALKLIRMRREIKKLDAKRGAKLTWDV